MKKLIIILALLPFLANSQMTPDSLLGCYAGTYTRWSDDDTTWNENYIDTLILYEFDTNYYDGGFYVYIYGILLNSDVPVNKLYSSLATDDYGFNNLNFSVDSFLSFECPSDGVPLSIFYNNDSIAYLWKCWAYSQQDMSRRNVTFFGKKYSSEIPDSVFHINVKNIKTDNKFAKIYPNPTKQLINIKLNKIENTILELINISGRTVFSTEFNSNNYTINMQKYTKGVYFIKLTNTNNSVTEKIIFL